jgi:hypothetical protein
MKCWLWVLVSIIALSGCAGGKTADTRDATYCLRLVEFTSNQPVATLPLLLIPRVILLKAAPGTPNPNLQYALKLITDENGVLCLGEDKLRELFSHFKGNGGLVDCRVSGFSRFTIEYNSISKKYLLTVFDKENQVRPHSDEFLLKGGTAELFLDGLLQAPDYAPNQADYGKVEETVIKGVQKIAADIEYLLKSQDGYALHSDIDRQEIAQKIVSMAQRDERGRCYLQYKECDYDKATGLRKCYDQGTRKELGAFWLCYQATIDYVCCELYGFEKRRTQLVTFDIMIVDGEITIFYPAAMIDVNESKTNKTHRDSCPSFSCKPQHYIE